MNETIYSNRLINEKSPYLLQHVHNPVNWYPWSEEAFSKAREEDKPIFLSIGYSTCHWCHVMERESFEDKAVAKVLNDSFISIKVDKEERPDIDSIYMNVCQSLTGSGGWPLTILMTPDKKPFYSGTYFPKNNLIQILKIVDSKWKNDKSELLDSAEKIVQVLEDSLITNDKSDIDNHILEKTFNVFLNNFDEKYGGFGNQPKFPTPHNLMFLLRYSIYKNNDKALEMVEKTLTQMYKGGIFDHIGFGFSRYSVDDKWLVPHFEKMLYDNAMLTIVYLETYLITKNELYKEIAEKTLDYILREMTSPMGGFYTAEDADSEGIEGKFYVWSKEEIYNILDKEDADYICKYYNITDEGNFENKNILNLIHLESVDSLDNLIYKKVEKIRKTLFNYREERVHPYKDDKILTSKNGLMIAAFAFAGKVLNNQKYIDIAEDATNFIFENLVTKENRILARYRDNEAKYLGYLDDYAFFIWGLTELFLATSKEKYIKRAIDFNILMLDLFEDSPNDGLFYVGKDSEKLLMKNKDSFDSAIPSANSVVAMNLLRLAEINDDSNLGRIAVKQINYFASKINQYPTNHTFMLSSYLLNKVAKTKIVVVTKEDNPNLNKIKSVINNNFNPFTTAIFLNKEKLKDSEYFSHYINYDHDFIVHICDNYTCNEPIFDIDEAINYIKTL